MEKKYTLMDYDYILMENYKDAFDYYSIKEKITDYFNDFDYIIGDWSYGKLRLKGFCNKNNKLLKEHKNIENYKDYIKDECAYDCKFFILKKV